MNQEFEQAMQRFIHHVRLHSPSSSTASHYENDLVQFGRVIEKAPRAIQAKDIEAFVTRQLNQGLQPATINRRLAALSHLFEYLAEEAADDQWPNPVGSRHRVKTGVHLPRDLSETTARQFWQAVRQGPVRDQAMVALMLDVGLRVGEVVHLRVSDFEPGSGPAVLAALRVRGKGNKERRVWLIGETATLVAAWLAERPAGEAEALFLTRRRRPFTRRGLQERVKHYPSQAGLPEAAISCHRLRHTFARRMAEARMPLPSLSHWLGHNHLSTTQVYIDGANPQLRADYQRAMAMLAENQAERADLGETAQSALVLPIPACVAQAPILEADEIRTKLQSFPTWLSQEVVLFLAAKQARWQPHYRRERAQQWLGELSRAWSWLLGQRAMATLADLHRADLADYVAHLHGQGLSSYTINHFLTTFWAFLKFAEERGALVAPGLYRLPRPQKPEWSPRPLSEAAYQRLQQALAQATAAMTPAEAACHRCWFFILADGGLRIGELRTLTVADWHAASRTLTIRYGKGRRQRQVLLTARAAQAIADHLATRQPTPPAPNEPLVAHLGQAVSPRFIRHHLHLFAQQAQLEGVTPHRLRHTYATRLLNTGQMPVTTLQKLMGHHDIDTTMRYVQLYDATIRRDFEAAMAVLQAQPTGGLDDTLWAPTIDAIFKVQAEAQTPVSAPPAPFANCMYLRMRTPLVH